MNAEGSSRQQMASCNSLITLQILCEAVSRVLIEDSDHPTDYRFDSKFDDLGMNSLSLAELIVELEEVLGRQLELQETGQLETLGDLCRALRPIGN